MRFGFRQIAFRFFQFVFLLRGIELRHHFALLSPARRASCSEVRCRSRPPVAGANRTSGLPPRSSPRAVTSSVTSPRTTSAIGITSGLRPVMLRYARTPYHVVAPAAAQTSSATDRARRRSRLPTSPHLLSCGGSASVTTVPPAIPSIATSSGFFAFTRTVCRNIAAVGLHIDHRLCRR